VTVKAVPARRPVAYRRPPLRAMLADLSWRIIAAMLGLVAGFVLTATLLHWSSLAIHL
jgi:hypothetical protein